MVHDDLKRVRGIDGTVETALNKLGVSRYGQIARWTHADVDRVNQSLGFRNRVESENWIEQAQILSAGGDTLFSRRRDAGSMATVTPPPAVLSAKPAAPVSAAGADAAAAAAAVAAAAASSVRSVVKPAAPAPEPAPAAAPAPGATSPDVARRAAFADPRPVAAAAPMPTVVAVATPAQAPVQAPAAAATVASVTPIRPAAAPARDQLQRIGGINAEVEKLLNVQGVTRYGQIGSWDANETDRFERLLGATGRIRRENWIEQAQILARGGDTTASRAFDQARGSASTAAPAAAAPAEAPRDAAALRPARLTEAIRDNQGTGQATSAPRAEIGGLRSVRSEAYQTKPVDAATAAAAAAAAASGSAKVVRAANMDDLKRIRGVGVLIEKRLNAEGVTSYDQIAQWTAADIAHFSQKLDFKGRIERENWVEQARILSSGGFTEFSRRVDNGEVETSKPRT